VGDREGRGKQAGQQPGRFKVRLGLEGRDIEIERHRNKEIEKHRNKETERQRDRADN
jgi:hypothetical protein